MTRYITGPPRADKWLDTHGHSESMVVYESDPAPQPTGLVMPDGRPIYRVRETVPMGFHQTTTKGTNR